MLSVQPTTARTTAVQPTTVQPFSSEQVSVNPFELKEVVLLYCTLIICFIVVLLFHCEYIYGIH